MSESQKIKNICFANFSNLYKFKFSEKHEKFFFSSINIQGEKKNFLSASLGYAENYELLFKQNFINNFLRIICSGLKFCLAENGTKYFIIFISRGISNITCLQIFGTLIHLQRNSQDVIFELPLASRSTNSAVATLKNFYRILKNDS